MRWTRKLGWSEILRGSEKSCMKIKLLYGDEFWQELNELLERAEERVFVASAYIGEDSYRKVVDLVDPDVFLYFAVRSDSGFRPPEKCLVIDEKYFHGKIYLIDNCVIIGSQNLYETKCTKQGEFNVLFEANGNTSSLILYQALLKIAQQSPTKVEPINDNFKNFYDMECPFCGASTIADPESIHVCPGYGDGSNFVSNEDCSSYGGDGACEYCPVEERKTIDDCYVCDDSGCGFGISSHPSVFLHHAINSPDEERLSRAKEFIRLFNFLGSYMPTEDLMAFYRALGFIGNIYNARIERMEWNID
jgi:hypothetical protein